MSLRRMEPWILLIAGVAVLVAAATTPRYIVYQGHQVSDTSERFEYFREMGFHATYDLAAGAVRVGGVLAATFLIVMGVRTSGNQGTGTQGSVPGTPSAASSQPNPSRREGEAIETSGLATDEKKGAWSLRFVNGILGGLFLIAPLIGGEDVGAALIAWIGVAAGVGVMAFVARKRHEVLSGGRTFLGAVLGPPVLVSLLAILLALGGEALASGELGAWIGSAAGLGAFFGLGAVGLRYAFLGGPFWKTPPRGGEHPGSESIRVAGLNEVLLGALQREDH